MNADKSEQKEGEGEMQLRKLSDSQTDVVSAIFSTEVALRESKRYGTKRVSLPQNNYHIYIFIIIIIMGAGLVYLLTTGWTTDWSQFEFRQGQEFSVLHSKHSIHSAVHPATYPEGTWDIFAWVKRLGR